MSNLPGVSGSRQDGGLRLPAPATDKIHLKMGLAFAGPFNTVISESSSTGVLSDFAGGLVVEAANLALESTSPVLVLRMQTSVAGGFSSYPVLVPAFDCTVAGAQAVTQVGYDTSVDVAFSAASAWDGNDLVFTGKDPTGAAQTETLAQADIQALGVGARVWRSARVWQAGSLVLTKGAAGASTGTATVSVGLKRAQGSQTSNSLIALSGTVTSRWDVGIRFTRDGVIGGSPTPAFNYTLDGGDNWSQDIAMPNTGVYALPAFTGVTITATGSQVKAGDRFACETFAPTWNNSDLSAALAAANASQFDFEALHVVGQADAVLAATLSSYTTAAENQSSPKWYTSIIEAADQMIAIGSPPITETEAAWINRISGPSPGFQNFADYRIGVCAGFAEILDPVSGRFNRRSSAWPYVARLMSISVGTSPAWTGLGPLVGISALYHDEDKREALNDQRFTTLRTFGRLQGFYVTLGRLMAPLGSDFRKIQSLRVINKVMRLVYDFLLNYVEDKVKVDGATGRILESQARAIELPMVTGIQTALGDDITEPRVQIDRTINLLAPGAYMLCKTAIVPVAYAEQIKFTIGLLNPATEVV